MKKYIAQKPCNFNGKHYYIGEEIPADAVQPDRESALLKYGIIVATESPDPVPATPAAEPEKGKADKKGPQGKKV